MMTMPANTRVRGQANQQAHPQAPQQAHAPEGMTEGSDTHVWAPFRPAGAYDPLSTNSSTEREANAYELGRVGARTQVRTFSCVRDLRRRPIDAVTPYSSKSIEDHWRNGRNALSQSRHIGPNRPYIGGSHSRGAYRRLSMGTVGGLSTQAPAYSLTPSTPSAGPHAPSRRHWGRYAPRGRGRNRNPKSRYRSTRIPVGRSAITKIQICRGFPGYCLYPQRTPGSSRLNPPPTPRTPSLTPRWCRPRREGVQHG